MITPGAGALLGLLAAAIAMGVVMLKGQLRARRADTRIQLLAHALQSANDCISGLQHTERKYREVVENANDIIFTVDREGYCLSMNRAGREISGHIADDSRGTHLRHLVAPEQLDMASRQLQRVLEGHVVPTFELEMISRQGNRVTLEVDVRGMGEGSAARVQGIARDVTARKALEAKLRQAQKMEAIGRLAGGIAHDFNNLLTTILGYCSMIQDRGGGDPELRDDIDEIRKAGERAGQLTLQLVAFGRKQALAPRVVNLNTIVIDFDRMLSRVIGEDIRLLTVTADDLANTTADASQIGQLLMNLVVNARDAMPHGGTIRVATANASLDAAWAVLHEGAVPGRYVSLTVEDSGCGMSPEVLSHVFEPFFTTKGPGKGTGLGLATVYGIVKQSGGYITITSTEGVGTIVTTYLAAVDDPIDAVVATPAVQTRTGAETVLLVEDDTGVRELMRKTLGAHGYTVLEARDVLDAIALAESHDGPVDLLLTDVVMPVMNGLRLAQRIVCARPAIKVLCISGFPVGAAAGQGSLSRRVAFLAKPFAPATLAAAVRERLDT